MFERHFQRTEEALGELLRMGVGDVKFRGAVNLLPKISNRAGEQAEKLPDFPIDLSENLPD